MRERSGIRPWVIFPVLVLLGTPAYVRAAGVRSYSFVELALESDVAVASKSIRRNGEALEIEVAKVVFGPLDMKRISASFEPVFRGKVVDEIGEPRLVFLSSSAGRFALVGAGMQAIWPQGDGGENVSRLYSYAGAKDLERLLETCKQLRDFPSLDASRRTSVLSRLLVDPDPFLRLSALQLGGFLRQSDPVRYKLEVDLAAAYALRVVQDSDLLLYYEAVRLLDTAPASAALRTLMTVIENPSAANLKRSNAFMEFARISGTGVQFEFQADRIDPDERVREEAIRSMKGWLEASLPGLMRADAPRIIDALESRHLLRRRVGRMWLESLAGEDFGFDESAGVAKRTAALKQIEAFLTSSKKGEASPT